MSIYRKLVLRFAIFAALLLTLYGAANASGPGCEKCLDEFPICLDQCSKSKVPPSEGCGQLCETRESDCLNACIDQ